METRQSPSCSWFVFFFKLKVRGGDVARQVSELDREGWIIIINDSAPLDDGTDVVLNVKAGGSRLLFFKIKANEGTICQYNSRWQRCQQK